MTTVPDLPAEHVAVDGRGPAVLLCSGLGGNWFDWDGVVHLLSSERQVIRSDRPGYGLNPPAAEVPSIRGEVERLRRLMHELTLRGPTIVVGHSLGGLYAEALARTHPSLVGGVVLVDGSVPTPSRTALSPDCRDSIAQTLAGLLVGSGVPTLVPTAHRLLIGSVRESGSSRSEVAATVLRGRSYIRALLREYAAYPRLVADLLEIRGSAPLLGPALVIAADSGRAFPSSARWIRMQRRAARELRAECVVLTPARHHLMVDRAADVAGLIRSAGSK